MLLNKVFIRLSLQIISTDKKSRTLDMHYFTTDQNDIYERLHFLWHYTITSFSLLGSQGREGRGSLWKKKGGSGRNERIWEGGALEFIFLCYTKYP